MSYFSLMFVLFTVAFSFAFLSLFFENKENNEVRYEIVTIKQELDELKSWIRLKIGEN